MAQTKSEVLDELTGQVNKDELVEIVGSKLKKDQLAELLQDDGGATKEELVRKLGSRTKQELADQLGSYLTKDELQRVLDQRSERADDHDDRSRDEDDNDTDTDIDWSAELDWAPPPRATPAPVTFAGAAPFLPGQRVRVDLAGPPMLGVFAGRGAAAAGPR